MTSAPDFDQTIPETASPKVEFISLSHLNPSTELNPIPTRGIDLKYFRTYVQSLEDGGYDYTLLPYGSGGADSFVVASAVGALRTGCAVIRPDRSGRSARASSARSCRRRRTCAHRTAGTGRNCAPHA